MDLGKTATDALTGAATGIVGGPIGMAVGLLTGIAPDLLSLFGPNLAGSQAATVAQQVVDTVARVTGIAQPDTDSIIGLDPAKAADLKIQLATIAMQAEQNRQKAKEDARDADLAELKARLADVATARDQTVQLAKAGSKVAWAAPAVSLVVMASFGYLEYLAWHTTIGADPVQIGIVETLKVLSVSVVGYWVGSSAGSKAKDDLLANSVPAPR